MIFACIFAVLANYSKDKKKNLYLQTIDIILACIANIFFFAPSGIINNFTGAVRNILCYNKKLTLFWKIFICISSVIVTIVCNKNGFIGFFPMISTIVYTSFIDCKNIYVFKIILFFANFFWLIFDFSIGSYVAFAFDIAICTATLISIIRIYNSNKRKEINYGTANAECQ